MSRRLRAPITREVHVSTFTRVGIRFASGEIRPVWVKPTKRGLEYYTRFNGEFVLIDADRAEVESKLVEIPSLPIHVKHPDPTPVSKDAAFARKKRASVGAGLDDSAWEKYRVADNARAARAAAAAEFGNDFSKWPAELIGKSY